MKLLYSLSQLHSVALYLWENNPYVENFTGRPKNVLDVMTHIQDTMRSGAISNYNVIRRERRLNTKLDSEWIEYLGTGGYYCLYELISDEDDDEIQISVTILVDLVVGKNENYVSEVVDTFVI